MQYDLPKHLTGENFANEGFLDYLKKVFGGKEKKPVNAQDDRLVQELIRRFIATDEKLDAKFNNAPFKTPGDPTLPYGNFDHVVAVFVDTYNWLSNANNLREAKRYVSEVNNGVKAMQTHYKANASKLDEDDLRDALEEFGSKLADAVKPPKFTPFRGQPLPETNPLNLSQPGTVRLITPRPSELVQGVRTMYKHYKSLDDLRKTWDDYMTAGDDWQAAFWEHVDDDGDVVDAFNIQSDPEHNLAPIGVLLSTYQKSLEFVLNYLVQNFDVDFGQ